jgi:CBS domain-containing protein
MHGEVTMRVRDVMSTGIKTVATKTTAKDAWRMMHDERIHHVVVKDGARIAGVFSDRDAGGAKGAAVRAGHTVGELMTEHVVTVRPETPIRRIANLMRGRSIGSIVVTDDKGRAVGIVTTSDLLEWVGRGALRPAPIAERRALNHQAPHRKRHSAYGVW